MDKNFKDLLTRYVNGLCTDEEREKIHQWYEQISDNALQLDAEEKALIGTRMLAKIQAATRHQRPRGGQRRMLTPSFFKAAAAVVALAVFSLWFFTREDFFGSDPSWRASSLATDMVYENTTNAPEVYELPDGSTVHLDPTGILRFRKGFSTGDREVYLTGNAFFDIVKDSSRPFYVYSGQVATRVLGTSFYVDAPPGALKVAVKVVTGKVSVFHVKDSRQASARRSYGSGMPTTNGVILSPNQRVDYYVEQGHWVTGLVDDPIPVKTINSETLSFVFSNTPVGEILEDINERFGIEVLTENERISQCTFTGDVSKMPLYDMLDVISNAIGSTYEVKGTRILVSGTGCDPPDSRKVVQ